MDSVTELTYYQLMNRLRFLKNKFSNFKLCANCGDEYNPVDLLCRARFQFGDDIYLCYKTTLNYEMHSNITCCKESFNLGMIANKFLDEPVIVVANTNKTYSICGVYVDEENSRIVLLNGYHNGTPVNWSCLNGGIY